jgi:hypothetical protein
MNERKTWFCAAMDFSSRKRIELTLRGRKV